MTKTVIFEDDLAGMKYLTKIATQCDEIGRFCAENYYLSVNDDTDDDFTAVCGTDSCPQLFTGHDVLQNLQAPGTVVTHEFDRPVAARVVRLYPQGDISGIHVGLRWEIYGCDSLV